ncbi:hypothetical protein PsorP6_017364 [Peronosclerospora sorghi]|uniref:Uncharacterized protein n=1 Tax=Peronosclerospora sorghi TaxID=230839 RepID=A0ACC0WLI6_9STRA|nr:hypothetical protein PsorP6_017364 [Peronosclerospora sorghi]
MKVQVDPKAERTAHAGYRNKEAFVPPRPVRGDSSVQEANQWSRSIRAVPRRHRAVDVVRPLFMVALHRRSSGRNVELQPLAIAAEAVRSASVLKDEERGLEEQTIDLTCNLERVGACKDDERELRLPGKDMSRRPSPFPTLAWQEEGEKEQVNAVAHFGLWGNAVKRTCLPAAIVFSESTSFQRPSDTASSFSSTKSSMDPSSVDEMVPRLHLTHPPRSLLEIPTAMAPTYSTSPRIKPSHVSSFRDTPSLRLRARSSILPKRDHAVAIERNATFSRTNTRRTQWKRGERIGEGTFGTVRGFHCNREDVDHERPGPPSSPPAGL